MSNKLFQNLINQMSDVIKRNMGVMDETGMIVAAVEEERAGEVLLEVPREIPEDTEILTVDGVTLLPLRNKQHVDYFVYVAGADEAAEQAARVLGISLDNLLLYYDDKYDKGYFIKNILLDNILPGDIGIKARELHVDLDARRAIFLIRTYEKSEVYISELIENLFPTRNKDFIFSIDEYNSVLVKEVREDTDNKELEKIASIIVNTLNSEAMLKVHVGVGNIAKHVKDLARVYKEAQVALDVGKIFESENPIMMYNNLGIGRLVYQLPTTLCELFLDEVFEKDSLDALDEETLMTINKFFECNLNVSETSRKLFVHRNTLVYRLNKIQKITNLDLRIFDHAIIFKIATMVRQYLDSTHLGY